MENPIDFSKRSRRAILIFVGVMLVLVLIPRAYFLLNPVDDFEFHQTASQKEDYKNFEYKKKEKKKYQKKVRFTSTDWMNLGLSEKQVAILMKFGSNGFYSDEDLKKVFVISDEFFAVIKDYLIYPEKPVREYNNNKNSNNTAGTVESIKVEKVELNTATIEELMNIKGFGKFYAEKIIQKRNEFQGFINEEQLLEIWKFDEEKLENVRPYVYVNTKFVRPFDINTVTYEELKKHPYFSNNVANSIIKLRAQLGRYKRIEDLKKSVLITNEIYEKIKPYVMVQE